MVWFVLPSASARVHRTSLQSSRRDSPDILSSTLAFVGQLRKDPRAHAWQSLLLLKQEISYHAGDQREDLSFASISLGERIMRGNTAAIAPPSARPYIVRRSSLNVSPHGAERRGAWPMRGSRLPYIGIRMCVGSCCAGDQRSALARVRVLLVEEHDRREWSSGRAFKDGESSTLSSDIAVTERAPCRLPLAHRHPRGRADAATSAAEIRHGRSVVSVRRWQWRRRSREVHGWRKASTHGTTDGVTGPWTRKMPVPWSMADSPLEAVA